MIAAAATAADFPLSASDPASLECNELLHERLKRDSTAWSKMLRPSYWTLKGVHYEQRECLRCGSALMRPCEVISVRYLDELPAAGGLH